METMTLEQMLAEELKLEAVLEKQEAAKKQKASIRNPQVGGAVGTV